MHFLNNYFVNPISKDKPRLIKIISEVTDEEIAEMIKACPIHFGATRARYPNWPPGQIYAEIPVQPSVAISTCDLMYYDTATHTAKPFSSLADAGSKAAQQAALTAAFIGVCNADYQSTDATTGRPARTIIDAIWEYPCVSQTFEIFTFVGADYVTNVAADQIVDSAADAAHAIGRVLKYYSAATTKVKCRITAPLLGKFA